MYGDISHLVENGDIYINIEFEVPGYHGIEVFVFIVGLGMHSTRALTPPCHLAPRASLERLSFGAKNT